MKTAAKLTCSDALNSRAPTSSQMEPGRVYIGRLPNYAGPVLVRRRRSSCWNLFGTPSVTSVYASPPAPQVTYQYNPPAVYQPPPPPYTQIVQPSQPIGTTTTTTTTKYDGLQSGGGRSKHTCASCGKFRSARYHYRHPLASGETPRPTLCRKCIKKYTSSDEFDEIERARWKRRQKERERAGYRRRPRRSDSFDEWSSSSSQEERRRHHRYRSSSGGPKNRRSSQSGSNVSTKIYVIRHSEERRRPQSSSEDIHVVRRVRSSDDRPGILRNSRHRYGPFDGHHSYEDYHSDEEFEDDGFERRGRSRSRDYSRHEVDGSHSVDEDYVRVTRSTSHPRRMGFLDRLGRSRSRSSSRRYSSRRGRHGSESFEDEHIRISIRSRDPSPIRYERHEEQYEERTSQSDIFPWRRQSDSVLLRRDFMSESRGDGFFRRPLFTYSGHVHDSRERGRPSLFGPRSVRLIRGFSPERRVRFARSQSRSSHRDDDYRHSSDEGFHSAGMYISTAGYYDLSLTLYSTAPRGPWISAHPHTLTITRPPLIPPEIHPSQFTR